MLPNELFDNILGYLEPKDIKNVRSVCKILWPIAQRHTHQRLHLSGPVAIHHCATALSRERFDAQRITALRVSWETRALNAEEHELMSSDALNLFDTLPAAVRALCWDDQRWPLGLIIAIIHATSRLQSLSTTLSVFQAVISDAIRGPLQHTTLYAGLSSIMQFKFIEGPTTFINHYALARPLSVLPQLIDWRFERVYQACPDDCDCDEEHGPPPEGIVWAAGLKLLSLIDGKWNSDKVLDMIETSNGTLETFEFRNSVPRTRVPTMARHILLGLARHTYLTTLIIDEHTLFHMESTYPDDYYADLTEFVNLWHLECMAMLLVKEGAEQTLDGALKWIQTRRAVELRRPDIQRPAAPVLPPFRSVSQTINVVRRKTPNDGSLATLPLHLPPSIGHIVFWVTTMDSRERFVHRLKEAKEEGVLPNLETAKVSYVDFKVEAVSPPAEL